MGISNLSFSATNINVGLDADKSATPREGDLYIATDTGILYSCFVDDTWSGVGVDPVGTIKQFHGLLADIQDGWQVCDGTNGTPDLRDTFVRGAANLADSGATGGADTHTLVTGEMPAHTHNTKGWDTDGGSAGQALSSTAVTNLATESTGGGGAHNNIPAYFALLYIMKL